MISPAQEGRREQNLECLWTRRRETRRLPGPHGCSLELQFISPHRQYRFLPPAAPNPSGVSETPHILSASTVIFERQSQVSRGQLGHSSANCRNMDSYIIFYVIYLRLLYISPGPPHRFAFCPVSILIAAGGGGRSTGLSLMGGHPCAAFESVRPRLRPCPAHRKTQ